MTELEEEELGNVAAELDVDDDCGRNGLEMSPPGRDDDDNDIPRPSLGRFDASGPSRLEDCSTCTVELLD